TAMHRSTRRICRPLLRTASWPLPPPAPTTSTGTIWSTFWMPRCSPTSFWEPGAAHDHRHLFIKGSDGHRQNDRHSADRDDGHTVSERQAASSKQGTLCTTAYC